MSILSPRIAPAPLLLASPQQQAASQRRLWPEWITLISAADRDSVLLSKLSRFEELSDLRQPDELLTRIPEATDDPKHIQNILDVHPVLEDEICDNHSLYKKEPIAADHPLITRETTNFPFLRRNAAHFFDAKIPKTGQQLEIKLKDALWLYDADLNRVGQAFITAGGAERRWEASRLPDGGFISAATVQNMRRYQQDGFYYAVASLPNGRRARILAATDGAGGHSKSEVASTAFLQGVHAGVQNMLLSGTVPTADELFDLSRQIMEDTTQSRGADKAVTTASVIVILGAQATVATAGDSMVALATRTGEGAYRTVGITEQDIKIESVGITEQDKKIEARSTSVLMRHASNMPHVYFVPELRAGDRFIIGSDGLWGNILQHGDRYKFCGTELIRRDELPPADQIVFNNLNLLNAHTAGQLGSAATFLNMARRAREAPLYSQLGAGIYHFPSMFDTDNMTALIYEHGSEDSPREWSDLADQIGPLWDVV